MIKEHQNYYQNKQVWQFMRDAWCGQSHIRNVAEARGYYKRRSNFTDGMASRYLRSGRYPNLVGSMINQGTFRALAREPKNMDMLSPHVEDVEGFLSWLLKELATVGGAGLALNLQGLTPSIVKYDIEDIQNWTPSSVAILDTINQHDEFGFVEDSDKSDVVMWMDKGIKVGGKAVMTVIDHENAREDSVLEWNSREVSFLPFCRVSTDDKPIFYGLAESSIDYFLLTALRSFILQQTVPQPYLILPDEEKSSDQQLQKFLDDKTIEYGNGSMIVLPFSSQIGVISPPVRSLSEMRHDLSSIKDEMVSQGVNAHLRSGTQAGNMNADTVRLHMNEQMLNFYDVLRQAERAINKMLAQINYLETGDDITLKNGFVQGKKFGFRDIDFADNDEIENLVREATKLETDANMDEGNQALIDLILEQIDQRPISSSRTE